MTKQEETPSTTGTMPWDNLFDFSYYSITQVKIETIVYTVEPLIGGE